MGIRELLKQVIYPLRRAVRGYRGARLRRHHMKELEKRLKAESPEYREYLKAQLTRTVHKHEAPLPERAVKLINNLSRIVDLSKCDILCIGCRNREEIDYLRSMKARSVVGIDLYSEYPDIHVMDMHDLKFEGNSFDLVYASHSLEHAMLPEKVAAEIRRVLRPGGHVAIEVPIQYETRGTDLQDYGSLENLLQLFSAPASRVTWSEQVPRGREPENPANDVLRVILRAE